jgi:competence protein ComEC
VIIPFLFGVLFGIGFYVNVILFLTSIFIFILLIILEDYYFKSKKWKFRWIRGLLIQLAFFISGLLLTNLKKENQQTDFYGLNSYDKLIVVVNNVPEEKAKSVRTFVTVSKLVSNGRIKKVKGNLLVYFKKDSSSLRLSYGDELMLNVKPKTIPEPIIGQFNYKRYLIWHQVFERAYCKSNQWILIRSHQGSSFLSWIYDWRREISNILKSTFKNKDEYAVANALLIGDDNDIDSDLMSAYTASGTLHVLSVSGMHVGVIYLLLAFVLGRLEKQKNLRNIYYPLIIILVWLYGILSGSSASVLRAAAMLTIVVFGKWINAKSSMYSSLCVSLFALLLYNPFLITETGLQLSYLAVFGIVYLHPKIYKSWSPPMWLVHKGWELTSISIAAQMVTAPLGFLVFGQFPNYFIIANLIVIPATTIAIYLTILQVLFKDVLMLEKIIIFCNTEIIAFVNRFVIYLETWPGAVTKDVFINIYQCVLLYCILFFFIRWNEKKDFNSLLLLISSVLLIYSFFVGDELIRIFVT